MSLVQVINIHSQLTNQLVVAPRQHLVDTSEVQFPKAIPRQDKQSWDCSNLVGCDSDSMKLEQFDVVESLLKGKDVS